MIDAHGTCVVFSLHYLRAREFKIAGNRKMFQGFLLMLWNLIQLCIKWLKSNLLFTSKFQEQLHFNSHSFTGATFPHQIIIMACVHSQFI